MSLPIVTLKSVATHQRVVSENITLCIFINDVLKGIKNNVELLMAINGNNDGHQRQHK